MYRASIPAACACIKFAPTDKAHAPLAFEGYASHFKTPDAYGDIILPGAFEKTIKERPWPVQMLRGHVPSQVIGRWTDMKEDDTGLRVMGELTPGHSQAQDVAAMLRHAGGSLSIGFNLPDPGGYKQLTKDPFGPREISSLELVEISVVTFPADRAARVDQVRALDSIEDFEAFLFFMKQVLGATRPKFELLPEEPKEDVSQLVRACRAHLFRGN